MIRYRHYRNSSRTDIMFKLFDKFDIADSILIDTGASVTTISVGKLIDHGISMEECKAFINNASFHISVSNNFKIVTATKSSRGISPTRLIPPPSSSAPADRPDESYHLSTH